MCLFVGLGNATDSLEGTRHNVGFLALDYLHRLGDSGPWRRRFGGLISRSSVGGNPVWLLKPGTMMNRSGQSVGPAARYFRTDTGNIIVFHDEIDLRFGKVRAKTGGGDAGHNGLRSITNVLGPDYIRVRIGVGRPPAASRTPVDRWVLSRFRPEEKDAIGRLCTEIAHHASMLVDKDLDRFCSCIGSHSALRT